MLCDIADAHGPDRYGYKASMLASAKSNSLAVPKGKVITCDDVKKIYDQSPDTSRYAYALHDDLTPPLVLRSSSVEEGHLYSFSGQYKSILNIRTPENITEGIIDIYRSAFTNSIQDYREELELQQKPEVAIIIQEMIDAEISGSMTTAPTSGDEDRYYIIEAVRGLGIPLFQGEATPDRIRLGRNGQITSVESGTQSSVVVPGKNERTLETVKMSPTDDLCIDEKICEDIYNLHMTCRDIFNSDVQTEWTIANETLWLLQVRQLRSEVNTSN